MQLDLLLCTFSKIWTEKQGAGKYVSCLRGRNIDPSYLTQIIMGTFNHSFNPELQELERVVLLIAGH